MPNGSQGKIINSPCNRSASAASQTNQARTSHTTHTTSVHNHSWTSQKSEVQKAVIHALTIAAPHATLTDRLVHSSSSELSLTCAVICNMTRSAQLRSLRDISARRGRPVRPSILKTELETVWRERGRKRNMTWMQEGRRMQKWRDTKKRIRMTAKHSKQTRYHPGTIVPRK